MLEFESQQPGAGSGSGAGPGETAEVPLDVQRLAIELDKAMDVDSAMWI
jgi:hypothetical protein